MRFLQAVAIGASRVAPVRKLLARVYRAQLSIAVRLFARVPGCTGIALRRPGVLHDAYPGNSDLDLSVFIDSITAENNRGLDAGLRVHRRLQRLAIPLGETFFLDARHAEEHFLTYALDYANDSDEPCWLHRAPGFFADVKLPRRTDALAASNRAKTLFHFKWAGEVTTKTQGSTVFSRDLMKLELKLAQLRDLESGGLLRGIDYREHFSPREDFRKTSEERAEILRRIESAFRDHPRSPRSELVPVHLANYRAVPEAVRDEAARAFGHLCGYEGSLLFDSHLYDSGKLHFLFCQDPVGLAAGREFRAAVRGLDECLARHGQPGIRTVPLHPDDARAFFVRAPLENLLARQGGLWVGEVRPGILDGTATLPGLPPSFLKLWAAEIACDLHSLLRREDPEYLLDLVFGQLGMLLDILGGRKVRPEPPAACAAIRLEIPRLGSRDLWGLLRHQAEQSLAEVRSGLVRVLEHETVATP